jgi:hypothetical protein
VRAALEVVGVLGRVSRGLVSYVYMNLLAVSNLLGFTACNDRKNAISACGTHG